jgi:potassium channel subfamily K
MNVARGSYNTTNKAVVGTQKQIGKGAKNVVKSMEKVVHGSPKTVAAMQGRIPTVNDSTYDEEAATENHSLLHDEIWDDETPRNAARLWAGLRERQDSIILKSTSSLSKYESTKSMNERKNLHGREMKKEIRSGLEFSLLHCLMAIVVYLGVAALAYSLVFEQWSVIDSIYFATVTFTTIGYGDLVPTSDASRLFTTFFAFTGSAGLGIALGVLGSNLIDAQNKAIDHARELSSYQAMSLFDSPQRLKKVETRRPSPWHWSALVRGGLPIFTSLLLCCWIVWFHFGLNVVSTFYYCITTATTIGYGDLEPKTQLERLLAVPFILLAVGAMGQWLSVTANAIIDRRQREFRKRFETRELTLNDLEVMDDDGDGKVTLAEYLAFMLVAMNKVDQEILKDLTAQFNRLDVDGTGSLEKEDLIIVAKRKLKSTKRKLQLAQYKAQLLKANSRLQEEKSSTLMTAIWSPHSTVI